MAIVSLTDDEIHRITVDEYQLMAEASDWERTELIDGVVYDMAPQYDLHAGTNIQLYEAVKPLFPGDLLRIGVTVRLGPFTAVDPDLAVIDGSVSFDRAKFIPPELVKLVVEVSVSTRDKDLGRKLQRYAEAGIPQYWVVDPRPEAGYLLRHTEPRGSAYARTLRYEVGEGAEAVDAAAVLAGEF
jgi:Uma2 family endonuclease